MANSHRFHIGDVLSVTSEIMVSPRGVSGLRGILAFMTNTGGPDDTSITDTGCLALVPRCKAELIKQYPWLSEIEDSHVTKENVEMWKQEIIRKHGEYLEVTPLP